MSALMAGARIAELAGQLAGLLQIRGRLLTAGNHGNAGLLGQRARRGLGTQAPDGFR